LPIIDGSRLNIVAQTAKRPPIGRPSAGQTSAILNGRELIGWHGMRLHGGVSSPHQATATIAHPTGGGGSGRSSIAKRRYRRP